MGIDMKTARPANLGGHDVPADRREAMAPLIKRLETVAGETSDMLPFSADGSDMQRVMRADLAKR
ncbi:MAG: hypothetical protein AAFQ45_09480 [Pseudomonadota bacterium]